MLYNLSNFNRFLENLVISQSSFLCFSFVTIRAVNLPGRTKTGLIAGLDKTVRAEHSCNSLLGHLVLHDLHHMSNETG